MNSKQSTFYFALALVNIVAGMAEISWLGLVTKPLLMLTLAFFYYQHTRTSLSNTDKIMLAALLFSCVGDTFLMFQGNNPNFFLYGLGAFLIAHVCYIIVFNKQAKQSLIKRLPFTIFLLFFLWLLNGRVPDDFRTPVGVYALVITIMGMRAAERHTSPQSYLLVLIGAILFMLSDSIIAINKFVAPLIYSGVWIMSTYVAAQYLIVKGIIAGRS